MQDALEIISGFNIRNCIVDSSSILSRILWIIAIIKTIGCLIQS